jgi:hypothetical protein
MKNNSWLRSLAWMAGVAAGMAVSSAVLAAEPPPQVSKEGLQLQKNTKSTLIYVRPGATWNQYTKLSLLDCYVEFDKGWERDYNSSRVSMSDRVSDGDMERIKKELAAVFRKVFTKELQENGGFPLVDGGGPGVLVLRPAIINLRVTAPDLMSPGINTTVVSSAGSATLYIELWDSESNTIMARAMDAQADNGFAGRGQVANRVTNQMAAEQILQRWATRLRKYLEAARTKPAEPAKP